MAKSQRQSPGERMLEYTAQPQRKKLLKVPTIGLLEVPSKMKH